MCAVVQALWALGRCVDAYSCMVLYAMPPVSVTCARHINTAVAFALRILHIRTRARKR
jgi:hypothetical protein